MLIVLKPMYLKAKGGVPFCYDKPNATLVTSMLLH